MKKAVAIMTNALLSNDLQKCLNWTGRCNNKAFSGLQCANIIKRELLLFSVVTLTPSYIVFPKKYHSLKGLLVSAVLPNVMPKCS